MRNLAAIALAAIVAVTGAIPPAAAALSVRDGSTWRPMTGQEVAARGDRDRDRGDRGDRSRDRAHRGRNDGVIIWRHRDRRHHHRPFFRFRHDRSPDCFIKKVRVRDNMGNLVVRSVRVCE